MINEHIEKLESILRDVLYSRTWCAFHGIDYANPDVEKAREELYREYETNKEQSK